MKTHYTNNCKENYYDENGFNINYGVFKPNEFEIERFLELQKKSLQFEDLTFNKDFYDSWGRNFRIKSKCLMDKQKTLYFEVFRIKMDDETFSFNKSEKLYCGDNNIIDGGYNLNRLFDNLNDALEYKKLLVKFKSKDKFYIKPTKGLDFDGTSIKRCGRVVYCFCCGYCYCNKTNNLEYKIEKQWQPQTGEYCMFYNENSKSFRVAQFKQIGIGKNVIGKFKDMEGNYFDFCLPYNHQLPDFLK